MSELEKKERVVGSGPPQAARGARDRRSGEARGPVARTSSGGDGHSGHHPHGGKGKGKGKRRGQGRCVVTPPILAVNAIH